MPNNPTGPPNQMEAMSTLLSRFGELQQRLTHMGTSIEALSTRLGHMAELSGRVNAAMMILVGLPRVFRSDLHHLIAYGTGGHGGAEGGSSFLAGLGLGGGRKKGKSGSSSVFKKFNENIEDLTGKLVDALGGNPLVSKMTGIGEPPGGKQRGGVFGNPGSSWLSGPYPLLGTLPLPGQANPPTGNLLDLPLAEARKANVLPHEAEDEATKRKKRRRVADVIRPKTAPGSSTLGSVNDLLNVPLRTDLGPDPYHSRGVPKYNWRQDPSLATDYSYLPDTGEHYKSKWGVDRQTGGRPSSFWNTKGRDLFSSDTSPSRFPRTLAELFDPNTTVFRTAERKLWSTFFSRGEIMATTRKQRAWGLVDRVGSVGHSAAMLGLGMGAVGSGLLQAASPDALNLLTGSIKLMAVALGQALIPMAFRLSQEFQYLAMRFHGMSSGTRGWIATLAALSIGGAGLLVVLGQLAMAVKALAPVFAVFAGNMTRLAITGASTAAALIALQLASQKIQYDQQDRDYKEAIKRKPELEEFEKDPLLRNALSLPMPKRKEALDIIRQQSAIADPLMKGMTNPEHMASRYIFDFAHAALGYATGGTATRYFNNGGPSGQEVNADYIEQLTKMRRRKTLVDSLYSEKHDSYNLPPELMGMLGNKQERRDQGRAQESNTLLLALQSVKGQPGYSDVSEAYKKIQLGALNDDPLTRKTIEWQRESLAKFADMASQGKTQETYSEEIIRLLRALALLN